MSQAGDAAERPGDRPRVLLLWPGGLFKSGANFGVPQLLSIAGVLRGRADAVVDVVDLDMERAFGPVDLRALARVPYDVVGISCYSSYDYLKVMTIAAALRSELPKACFVTGGYHPSAAADDFTGPDSPFDYVVVGDGEAPLTELVSALGRGAPPTERVLGPEPWMELDALEPYDWTLLERYRPMARRAASQAEIYLSRGCPHRCSFCMEGAKRETAWRAFEPQRALEELHRLDAFLDLSRWTVFITDAAFGVRPSWRKALLAALAERPTRARKLWLLTRADSLDRDDLELMARANVAPGFGLESGDEQMLGLMHKASGAESYLEHMIRVAEWARELSVPFGANVIVGHPGETHRSMQRSAAYLRRLFLSDARGTTGFLSVDPFRLYPGSPVAGERAAWEQQTGMRAFRYPWWHDGDQDFLAEWLDPSRELDFRTALRLRRELFDPIVQQIPGRFRYDGPARAYFRRAIEEQIELTRPRRQLHTLGMWHLWQVLIDETGDVDRADGVARDSELGRVAMAAREDTLATVSWSPSPALREALLRVPREQYVRLEDVAHSADDCALTLSDDHRSTLSAMHAYAAAFEALALDQGDHLVELGGGNGYGAALASEVVGPNGAVLSVELDADLAAQARWRLSSYGQTRFVHADAHQLELWRGATKIYVAFALPEVPPTWLAALGEGGLLVAPIGPEREQNLTRFEKTDGAIHRTVLGPVRYVPDRTE